MNHYLLTHELAMMIQGNSATKPEILVPLARSGGSSAALRGGGGVSLFTGQVQRLERAVSQPHHTPEPLFRNHPTARGEKRDEGTEWTFFPKRLVYLSTILFVIVLALIGCGGGGGGSGVAVVPTPGDGQEDQTPPVPIVPPATETDNEDQASGNNQTPPVPIVPPVTETDNPDTPTSSLKPPSSRVAGSGPIPIPVTIDPKGDYRATSSYTYTDLEHNTFTYENRTYDISVFDNETGNSIMNYSSDGCEHTGNNFPCLTGNKSYESITRIAILNEDGSIAQDHEDGVVDGLHLELKHNPCPNNSACYGDIQFPVLSDNIIDENNIFVTVYSFHGETAFGGVQKDPIYKSPQRHHLDYMALGYWMEQEGKASYTLRTGGSFYGAAPDFNISISRNDPYAYTHGIRGKATYNGITVGTVSRLNDQTAANQQFIGHYTGDVALSADFGPTYKFNNNFKISGMITNIEAVNEYSPSGGDSTPFPVHSSIKLHEMEGGISENGAIWTTPGQAQVEDPQWGQLEGKWDVSFHGNSNKLKDPELKEDFYRPPPVIGGSYQAESDYKISDTEYGTVNFDGVFGTFKNSENIEYTGKGR